MTFRRKLLAASLFIGADYLLLRSLPPLGISFGRVELPFLLILSARMLLLLLFLTADGIVRWIGGSTRLFTGLWLIAQTAISFAMIDAFCIEPLALGVTELHLHGPAREPGKPLRILHITDLHIERLTRREEDLLVRARELKPDLILLTGDYLNVDFHTDPESRRDARQILGELHAPFGVFTVEGNTDYSALLEEILAGTDIVVLKDEMRHIPLGGGSLELVGLRYRGRGNHRHEAANTLARFAAEFPPDAYSILLYHSPDLAEAAADAGIDLYLAGHTHGGQIRIPFYHALVTFSETGKRFEMGAYRIQDTLLYVSRGAGMEGKGWPRARFLCPPEIVLLELDPSLPE